MTFREIEGRRRNFAREAEKSPRTDRIALRHITGRIERPPTAPDLEPNELCSSKDKKPLNTIHSPANLLNADHAGFFDFETVSFGSG